MPENKADLKIKICQILKGLKEEAHKFRAQDLANCLAHYFKINYIDEGLTCLDLSDSQLDDQDITFLCNALKQQNHFTSLNLSGNKISESMSSLGEMLTVNTSLETVILSNNKINDKAIHRFCIFFHDHTGVKTLDLQNNELTEVSIFYFECLIRSHKHPDIRNTVWLFGNNPTGLTSTQIQERFDKALKDFEKSAQKQAEEKKRLQDLQDKRHQEAQFEKQTIESKTPPSSEEGIPALLRQAPMSVSHLQPTEDQEKGSLARKLPLPPYTTPNTNIASKGLKPYNLNKLK